MERTDVLIDPSLILAENSIDETYEYIVKATEIDETIRFYLPRMLKTIIEEETLDKPSIQFYLHGARPVELVKIKDYMKSFPKLLDEFEPSLPEREKHYMFYEGLIKELRYRGELIDDELVNLLFEEWVFLQERSWIVSRIKKTFNRFISAGAVGIQFSQRTIDNLMLRTLKKDIDYSLRTIDRLRALGKWIAVGIITPTLASVHPLLSGIPGLFMLFDPEITAAAQ